MMGRTSGVERLLYDKLQEPVVVVVVFVVVWYRLNRQLEFIVRDMLLI